MGSYEDEIKERIASDEELPSKLDISTMKYFWLANPLIKSNKKSIPHYLRSLPVLKNFGDKELHTLSKYFHLRTFAPDEVIFKQNDVGMGFYFIVNGQVDILVDTDLTENEETAELKRHVVTLSRGDYFGELALLQERSFRSATALSKNSVELLGVFKPDVEELIKNKPHVAAKLLQSISMIIANRLYSITREVGELKYKISKLEKCRETTAK